MFSEFKSFSFLGVSDSLMFLSEKDLNSMELNFLVRPTLDFQDQCPTAPSEEEVEDHELYKKPEVYISISKHPKHVYISIYKCDNGHGKWRGRER